MYQYLNDEHFEAGVKHWKTHISSQMMVVWEWEQLVFAEELFRPVLTCFSVLAIE